MARQLVDDMTDTWKPEQFKDSFTDAIMALVQQKVKQGKVETVEQPEVSDASTGTGGAKIIDLTELLQRSLHHKGSTAGKTTAKTPAKTSAKPANTAPARKPAAKTGAASRRRAA